MKLGGEEGGGDVKSRFKPERKHKDCHHLCNSFAVFLSSLHRGNSHISIDSTPRERKDKIIYFLVISLNTNIYICTYVYIRNKTIGITIFLKRRSSMIRFSPSVTDSSHR